MNDHNVLLIKFILLVGCPLLCHIELSESLKVL